MINEISNINVVRKKCKKIFFALGGDFICIPEDTLPILKKLTINNKCILKYTLPIITNIEILKLRLNKQKRTYCFWILF